MSKRRGQQAIDWGMRQITSPSEDFFRKCLRFVRLCYGDVPSATWNTPNDATRAFADTKYRHPPTPMPPNIPAGVPIWYSGGKNGHVTLSVGGGRCLSNDIVRPGKIDLVPVNAPVTKWGFKYLGWTEDINGVRVYTPAAAPTPGPTPSVWYATLTRRFNGNTIAHTNSNAQLVDAIKKIGKSQGDLYVDYDVEK